MLRPIAIVAVALLAATPVVARQTPEAELARALAGRVAGPPVRCVSLHDVQSTQVIARTGILYRIGGTLYLNRTRNPDVLRRDDITVTRTFGGLLCRPEVVQLVDPATRGLRNFVGLGDFVPYRRPRG